MHRILGAIGKARSHRVRAVLARYRHLPVHALPAWSTSSTDDARRQRVRHRVIDYNTQLAQARAAYGSACKFDSNAVFDYQFPLAQLSTWDYFHPNTSGQAKLAQLSYTNTFNW
jgi:lysophospholipase L1-like esterase